MLAVKTSKPSRTHSWNCLGKNHKRSESKKETCQMLV